MRKAFPLFQTALGLVILEASISFGDEPKARSRAAEPAPSVKSVYVKHCRLEYDESSRITSPSASFLQDLYVGLGEKVKAGQVIGRLFDKELRAEFDQLTLKAENDINISLAKTDLALAQAALAKTLRLEKRAYTSNEVMLQDRYAVQRAEFAVALAEFDKKIAQVNLRRVQEDIRARELVAPHDGIVVELSKNQGESLMIGDPILRLVNTGRLKVWASVNVPDVWAIKIGQPVRVVPDVPGIDLAIEQNVFKGQVVFINREIDSVTQTCQILALIENRDESLRGGLVANMEVKLMEGQALLKTSLPKSTSRPLVPDSSAFSKPTESSASLLQPSGTSSNKK